MGNVCDDASFWQMGIGELAAKEPFLPPPPPSSVPHTLPPKDGKRGVGVQKQESFFFFCCQFYPARLGGNRFGKRLNGIYNFIFIEYTISGPQNSGQLQEQERDTDLFL